MTQLGNNTSLVSPERLAESRNRRIELKQHAGELMPKERVSWCLHKLKPGETTNSLMGTERLHKASLNHVALCGSVWQCPVCSARIAQARREEISKALESNLLPVMITLTVQHHAGEPLAELVEALKDSWRRLKAGGAWLTTKERFHLVHYVSAFEIRHGQAGWHPHIHVLAFLDMPESDFKPDELKERLLERYKRLLGTHGRYILDDYGLDVRAVNGRKELNEYMSKLGMQYEISQAAAKLGRDGESFSPFQLLALSMEGDRRAGELFKEYVSCMNGRKFIQWSRGARAYFELDAELTDEQIVEQLEQQEQDDTRELIRFPKATWYKLVGKRLVPGLLRVGDSCNIEAIVAFLEFHQFRRGLDFEVMA